jgi:hypothetical protein
MPDDKPGGGLMPACPRPQVRINSRRTGKTRYRVHQSRGWFSARGLPTLLVLQLEWAVDVQDCNTRQIVDTATHWQDARPEDLINNHDIAGSAA